MKMKKSGNQENEEITKPDWRIDSYKVERWNFLK